jgi:hypothetical protein
MKLILSLALVTVVASAEAATVAAKIRTLEIKSIAKSVEVLKSLKTDKDTRVMLGLPVSVQLTDACTTFVGQQEGAVRLGHRWIRSIQALGSFDPMADACIEIAVEPVETTLSVELMLPKEIPAGDVTYFQDVVVGKQRVRVTYKPNAQQGSARALN